MKTDLSEYLNPLPKRPTVIESLIRQVLSLIKEANLQPGDKLPSEKEIIVATGASRPSVREALRALKTMGVIESRAGQGSFLRHIEAADAIRPEVVHLTLMNEDFGDIIEARRALECEIARLVARGRHHEVPAAAAALREMTERVHAGQDIYEATWDLHLALAEAAGNPVMARLLAILYEMIREAQLEVYWPKIDLREEVESHRKLYQEITSGDEERAVAAMRQHLTRMIEVAQRS